MSKSITSLLILLLATGLTVLSNLEHEKELAKARDAGYQQGFKDGFASINLKTILSSNQKAANQLCNKWWFGMTSKERTLNKT